MVPYLTACLITMVSLAISFKASAEQRLVDVMFALNRIKSSVAGILRHTWYKGDAQVAELDLKIGVSPGWRTWSSKRIVPKAHVGNWKVVISTVGEASEVICVAHFVVR